MKLIKGFDLPNESLSRNYDLIPKYDLAWRDWLQTTGKQFKNSIPTNGIVESIEKICSSNEYKRFVIIKGEVAFYKILLDGKCEVITDVMDLVSCQENMTVEEYRDYVYNLMNTRYNQL